MSEEAPPSAALNDELVDTEDEDRWRGRLWDIDALAGRLDGVTVPDLK